MKTVGAALRCRLRKVAGAIGVLLFSYAGFSAAQAPAAPRFEIQRYTVEGNTLLPQSEIDAVLRPHTGRDRDFGDIQRGLEALQGAYAGRGYSAVRVSLPEQDIRAGQVRLVVVEARINRVRVQGNRFFDEPNVRAGLPSLKEGGSPNTRAISREAQLVNDSPAKQVSVALQAADDPGKVDATVRVQDESPSRVSAFLDNSGTPSTGYYRLGAGYQHANVFNRDHVLSTQVLTSPGHVSDVRIFGVGYHVPLYGAGGTVDAVAGYSSVDSGTVEAVNLNVAGKGKVFGLRYTQLLGRIDTYEHRVVLGLDYRAYDNDVTQVGSTTALVSDVTVRPVSLAYIGRLSQVGRDLSFNVSVSRNIPGGSNGSEQDIADQGRPEAKARYTITRLGLAYTQLLPSDFILRAAANAQQTKDLLIPGEQFGMGGADSVRGYYEREVASDVGRRFSLEAYSPDFGPRLGSAWRARALVFADTAQGHDNTPVRNPENKLASFGIGLRVNMGKSLAGRLDVARPTRDAGTRLKGDSKVHAAVAYSF
ncbi:MAG: ShlB/FhaC/HecB family hemolysin secretion/activation protein [Burkholderiales bacterium]